MKRYPAKKIALAAWRGRTNLIGVMFVVLAACAQPPVPRDQFWRLDSGQPVQHFEVPPIDGTVAVERLRAVGLISQRPILFSTAEQPNRIEQHSYQYWIEIPPLMLRDAMIDYMRAANVAAELVTGDSRRAAGCELSGTLRQMEHVTSGGAPSLAVVEIELRLERINDGEAILHRTYRAEQTAADLTIEATVIAFDQALRALLARFVDELASRATACPRPIR
ncbi:MAG: ABC-type transport auxiliary lipoprotein family protein [Alphaproteobacteria bacterium]